MPSITSVNVGQNPTGVRKRGQFNLSCKSSFSSNFGRTIPTYVKEFDMGSKIHIADVNSIVRCASLAVPTFGDMQLNHYHCFVPYCKIYEPFNAFRSRLPYNFNTGTAVPTQLPTCSMSFLLDCLGGYLHANRIEDQEMYTCIRAYTNAVDPQHTLLSDEEILVVLTKLHNLVLAFPQICVCNPQHSATIDNPTYLYYDTAWHFSTNNRRIEHKGAPTLQSYDVSFNVDISSSRHLTIYVKYGQLERRLKELLIGLGYGQAYSGNSHKVSLLPLMAFYYSWWSIFGINKNINFDSTNCARIKRLFETSNTFAETPRDASQQSLFGGFMYDLIFDTPYTFAPDFFNSHVLDQSSNQAPISLHSVQSLDDENFPDNYRFVHSSYVEIVKSDNPESSISQKMASVLMRFININTVVGRNMASWFKSHFNMVPTEIPERICFGSSSLPIQVAKVISTAETADAQIGDYRGFAQADGHSQRFEYDVRDYGIYICISVVVPRLGYYQGADTHIYRKTADDFYTPDFDSLGYEATHVRTFNSDVTDCNSQTNDGLDSVAIGLRPRFLDMKVKHDQVNGALRFHSSQNQYGGYILNRNFGSSDLMVNVTADSFRKLDYFHDVFNLNRIFNSVDMYDEHFFVDSYFSVHALMPMIPIQDSWVNQEQIGSNEVSKS